MARITTPLTDIKVKSAKSKAKNYKLSDGRGLFLLIKPTGSKLWRLKYRFNNKEKEYAIGAYPTISLSKARKKREELKELVADGIDPNVKKKQDKEEIQEEEAKKKNTFYKVSQEWLKNYKDQVSEDYHTRLGRDMENYLYCTIIHDEKPLNIEDKPIDEITKLELLSFITALKEKGLLETARRTATLINRIYKYADLYGTAKLIYIDKEDKKTLLGEKIKNHYPTFTKAKDIKGLLHNIDGYEGDYFTKMALRVLPYVFVRSYNIRHMEWVEIDFKAKVWTIPKEKMKTKTEFILPLPHQVINILEEIKLNRLSEKYVFPSSIHKDRPLSDNTLISALRRMGYSKDEFVPHGFRAMFKTTAENNEYGGNSHGYGDKISEALLAHGKKDDTEAAYNRSDYKEPMRGLIVWYADYLEGVKNG